jgi:adenylate cyclase
MLCNKKGRSAVTDHKPRFASGEFVNNLRIVTGLILFTFATFHLLNHALGLVSIEVMSIARDYRIAITRSTIGTTILVGAALTHLTLGLAKFVTRRGWKMSFMEAVQLGFGVLIPLFMARHGLGTRGAHELFAVDDDYIYALFVMWPGEALNQLALITLVWVHGCIGIYMWLRMKKWFLRYSLLALGVAILVPVLAFSGFSVGGRIVRTLYEFENPFKPQEFALLKSYMDYALWIYIAFLVAFLVFRLSMTVWGRLNQPVIIDYLNGPTIKTTRGFTLLETSRAFDIPHASICGGKARCSTCRVRVMEGLDQQPAANETERRVLKRIGATENVRLACQLRPVSKLSIVPLLPAKRTRAEDARSLDKYFWGVEQKVTLMFADLRGFTAMSENQLPYDVVFLLNQFLGNMSEAIEDAGGYIDKFMGDGIMVIFGMDSSREKGARQALMAAKAMSGVLDSLNASLADELPSRLNIGIGLHTGDAILGRIGVASTSGAGDRITALGDTVNTASRLESSTKELASQLVVSITTMNAAGMELPEDQEKSIKVKGKAKPLQVYAWKKATALELSYR